MPLVEQAWPSLIGNEPDKAELLHRVLDSLDELADVGREKFDKTLDSFVANNPNNP